MLITGVLLVDNQRKKNKIEKTQTSKSNYEVENCFKKEIPFER